MPAAGKRRALIPLLAVLALLAFAPPAAAKQRLITIQTPSRFVDPATQTFNGDDHPGRLQANVLLPHGYAAKPRKRWPLLLLLHGAGDNWQSWANPENGDIRNTAKGLRAIIVMPEGAKGFYADWWNEGKRRPAWERHFREELIPLIERRFRIRPGRRWHTVAGLSMGGYGSLLTGATFPGYFGGVVPLSAFADPQRPQVVAAFPAVTGASYETIFGPMDGFYAMGHNPVHLARNLRHSRVDMYVGDGNPDPAVGPPPSPFSGPIEAELKSQNDELFGALRRAGSGVRYTVHAGVHDWPYWRADLKTAIRRGLFRPLPTERPNRWVYKTTAKRGQMWLLRFRFKRPPSEFVTFVRRPGRLRGHGSGTVTLRRRGGCTFTVKLPFNRRFPPSRCR